MYFRLNDFGAVGDGAADDTSAIISALSASFPGNLILDGEGKTYRVTDHLGEIPSNTILCDMVIDCREVVGGTSSGTESLFTATGSVGTAYELAADSTTADGVGPYISLSSSGEAANFTNGDTVRFQSDEVWSTSLNVGEMAVVKDVVDEKVYLQTPLIYNYTTANNSTIQKINPVENIRFENVSSIGPTSLTLTDEAEKLGFFAAQYAKNIKASGGNLRGFNRSGIEFRWTLNARLYDVDLEDFIDFYGVSIYNGSMNIWVDRCSFLNTRHAVTISSSNTNGGGICNHIFMTNNVSTGRDASFDAHPGADNVVFTGNIMHGEGTSGGALGLMFNGRNLLATNNTFIGYGGGIVYQPLFSGQYNACVNISDNKIIVKNPSTNSFVGIYAQIGTTFNVVRMDSLVIGGNTIQGNLSIGVYVLLTGGSDPIETISIGGNTITGAKTPIQIRSNTTAGYRGVSIAGNSLRDFITGINLRADSASATIEGVTIAANSLVDGTTGISRNGSATFKNIVVSDDNTFVGVTTPWAASFNTMTISSGQITLASPNGPAFVDTEGSAATDDLDTIFGAGRIGDVIVIQSTNAGRDTTVKHNTGNIRLAGGVDFTLSNTTDAIALRWTGSVWAECWRVTV